MTTLLETLDLSVLALAVRKAAPTLTSAFVVGSATSRPKDLVQDIDITAFDPQVGVGEDRNYCFDFADIPVHVVSYHPSHFDAMTSQDLLVLLFLREIRKLRQGLLLFDVDGHGAALLDRMRRVDTPIGLLEEQFRIIADGDVPVVTPDVRNAVAADWNLRQRLNLYFLVENAVFYLLHLDAAFMYSKPKWIMSDVAQTGATAVRQLVDAVSAEYTAAGIVPQVADQVQAVVAQLYGQPGIPEALYEHAVAMAKDARQLARKGEPAAASWPLRMSVLMIARCIAVAEQMPYQDCRSLQHVMPVLERYHRDLERVAHQSVLADTPLDGTLASLWGQAKMELCERRQAALKARSQAIK